MRNLRSLGLCLNVCVYAQRSSCHCGRHLCCQAFIEDQVCPISGPLRHASTRPFEILPRTGPRISLHSPANLAENTVKSWLGNRSQTYLPGQLCEEKPHWSFRACHQRDTPRHASLSHPSQPESADDSQRQKALGALMGDFWSKDQHARFFGLWEPRCVFLLAPT